MTKKNLELARLKRKEAVAQLRLQGHSLDAIYFRLKMRHGKDRVFNPKSNKCWSRDTIWRDITELETYYQDGYNEAKEAHRARQFAELQGHKMEAWSKGDLHHALKALQSEMDLLGTKAPKEMNVNIEVFTRLTEAIEKRGMSPGDVLEKMIQHLHAQEHVKADES